MFRGKCVDALRRAYDRDELAPRWRHRVAARPGTVARLRRRPLPDRLGRLCQARLRRGHRSIAVSRTLHASCGDQQSSADRLVFDGERVTFRWKDYAHGNQRRTLTLTAMEFLRRFIQHVLPRGFVRIRHFGYLASACRTARLTLGRALLEQPALTPSDDATPAACCRSCKTA